MKRVLQLSALCVCLLWAQSVFASATFKNKCITATNAVQSTVACSISGANVSSGDLIVAFVGWETDALTATLSDGTTSFTGKTVVDCGAQHCHIQPFYLLASMATGTPTYTATITGASVPAIAVFVFTPSAAVTFDTEAAGGTNNSTSIDSGSLTTTGSDELVVAGSFMQNGPTTSAWQIGGSSAATNEQTAFAGAYTIDNWYLAAMGTVNGTETLSGSNWWVAAELSFKIAGGSAVRSRSLLGVGQ